MPILLEFRDVLVYGPHDQSQETGMMEASGGNAAFTAIFSFP